MYPNNQPGQPNQNNPEQPGNLPQPGNAWSPQPAQPAPAPQPAQQAEQPLQWGQAAGSEYDPSVRIANPGMTATHDFSDTTEFPVDYLNKIDTSQNQGGPSAKLMLGMITLGVLSVIGFGIFAFTNASGSDGDTATNLNKVYVRMETLQRVTDTEAQRLKSSVIRANNSNLGSFLGSARADIKGLGILPKKEDKKLKTAEKAYQAELETKYDEAALNGYIDRVYAQQTNYELELIHIKLNSIAKNTKIKALKNTLGTIDNNLGAIYDAFKSFTSTTN